MTIDVNVKEWRDRTYGNTYYAAHVTVEYGTDAARTFRIPFQYGNANMATWEAKQLLEGAGLLTPESAPLSVICRSRGIILRESAERNCPPARRKGVREGLNRLKYRASKVTTCAPL